MNQIVQQLLQQQLSKAFEEQTAKAIGITPNQAKSVAQNALPVLLGKMSQSAQTPDKAEKLLKALSSQKHNGDTFTNLDSLIAQPEKGEGNGIIKHILGDTKEDIEEALAQNAGTNKQSSHKMLMILAPMIMGALGKTLQSEKLSADQLVSLVKDTQKATGKKGVAHTIANKFLDKDRDGNYKDDLFEIVRKWIAKKLGS